MALTPAIADAYRNVVVTQDSGGITYGGVNGTATSKEVAGSLNLHGGFGISLVTDNTDPANPKITIVNTGNGTGALTTINDQNSSGTYFPIFTRAPGPSDINIPTGTYQMDTMYLDQTTTPMTYNPNTGVLSLVSVSASGHITVEGVTSTGATGTGKFVFDTSPEISGATISNAASIGFAAGVDINEFSTDTSLGGIAPSDDTVSTEAAVKSYVDAQNFYIGTTNVAINRASAPLGLAGISSIGIRDTSAAFDVTLGATSSTTLTAARTLTLDVVNSARTLKLAGNATFGADFTTDANAISFTTSGSTTLTLPTTGTVTALGNSTTGSGSIVLGTSPTISGTSTSITNVGTFALRDTSAAFDVTIEATSNPILTAGRTLTVNVENAARSLTLGGNIDIANNLTTSGNFALTLTTTNTTNATLPSGTVTLAANNQTMFIGTTSVAINRTTAALALTGISSITGDTGTSNISVLTANTTSAASGTVTVSTGTTTTSGTTGATTVSTGASVAVSGALTLSTGTGTTSGAISIDTGVGSSTNGNISIGTGARAHNVSIGNSTGTSAVTVTSGTGNVNLVTSKVVQGVANTDTTITTNGTSDLTLSTNDGTNSGTILITNGAAGNIEITPAATGDVYLNADNVRVGDAGAGATIITNGAGSLTIDTGGAANLTLRTNGGTNSGTIAIANGVNGNITLTPNGTGTTSVSRLAIAAGTGTAGTAPIKIADGTVLGTAEVGTLEYASATFYATENTTSGRGAIDIRQTFHLSANGTAFGPAVGNFFGANSALNLEANSTYEIECFCYFLKSTAGTLTWAPTVSSAAALIRASYQATPITGFLTTVVTGADVFGYATINTATAATFAATGSLTTLVNHIFKFTIRIRTTAACNFRMNVTQSAGTITPAAGSHYVVSKINASTGAFVA